jgi:hypothetical protein
MLKMVSMRFENTEECLFTGFETNISVLNLSEGWNLIGSISSSISIENIIDPGQIIIPGTIFSFSDTYTEAATIEPGRGYWIKAFGDGVITVTGDTEN